jgi:hypothetical protein
VLPQVLGGALMEHCGEAAHALVLGTSRLFLLVDQEEVRLPLLLPQLPLLLNHQVY